MDCYILTDGFDLDDCAGHIAERTENFIAPYAGRTSFINEQSSSSSQPDDYPEWNLGIQFEFDALSPSERRDIILFFYQLSTEIGRSFVLGGRRANGDESEDWHFIDANDPIEPILDFVAGKI